MQRKMERNKPIIITFFQFDGDKDNSAGEEDKEKELRSISINKYHFDEMFGKDDIARVLVDSVIEKARHYQSWNVLRDPSAGNVGSESGGFERNDHYRVSVSSDPSSEGHRLKISLDDRFYDEAVVEAMAGTISDKSDKAWASKLTYEQKLYFILLGNYLGLAIKDYKW